MPAGLLMDARRVPAAGACEGLQVTTNCILKSAESCSVGGRRQWGKMGSRDVSATEAVGLGDQGDAGEEEDSKVACPGPAMERWLILQELRKTKLIISASDSSSLP